MGRSFLKSKSAEALRLARPEILKMVPYVAGRSIDEMRRVFKRRDFIKVASNENPLGPSPRAVAAIKRALTEVRLYPEQGYPVLKTAVARRFRLRPENVFLGNGSSEALVLAAGAFMKPGDEAIMASPSFVMHEHAVAAAGGRLIQVPLKGYRSDLSAMASAVTRRTRLIYVCNPNNPTGTIVTRSEVRAFLSRLRGGLLVVFDEAYAEFVDDPGYPDSISLVRKGLNVLVVRTLAKLQGLAGLRVGFGLAPKEIIGVLERLRAPFNVNLLAYRGASAALGDSRYERKVLTLVKSQRRLMERRFVELGLEVVPSQANFMMVRVGDGRRVSEALLREGVIVRPLSGDLLRPFVRITVGTPSQNLRVIGALRKVLTRSGL